MKVVFRKFMTIIGYTEFAKMQPSLFFINLFFQRILGRNSNCKFQVHFTSLVEGVDSNLVSESFKFSCAVSGSANIVIRKNSKLTVGKGTIFAQNLCIRTANHDFDDRSKYISRDVKIGENCWLGHGVVITPGVILGNNVTVGANSVITKSFPSNIVIAGVPATVIKKLKS